MHGRSRSRRNPFVDGLVIAGLLFAGYLFLVVAPKAGTVGFDAFAYWSVDLEHPYLATAGRLGAFTYSPVAARAFAIASSLPWWQFLWLWEAILVATVVWLGRRPTRIIGLLAFPPVALELYHGNVHLLLAAAIVLGFRYPAAWAFVLLTKVTPGVGLVWFLVRREWRSLGIAVAVTAAIVALSVVVDGRLWSEWFDDLRATASGEATVGQFSIDVPIWLRVPVAAAFVAWGARTDRRWTVPVGATLALPVLWPSGFAVLAALWRLGPESRTAHGPGQAVAVSPGPVAATAEVSGDGSLSAGSRSDSA